MKANVSSFAKTPRAAGQEDGMVGVWGLGFMVSDRMLGLDPC